MSQSYVETVSALTCCGPYRFPVGEIAAEMQARLAKAGFRLDRKEFVDLTEVVLCGDGLILSVCRVDADDHDILVAAETPRGDDAAMADQRRLLLCASATRILCELLSVSRIAWWHRGAFYITESDREVAPLFSRPQPRKQARTPSGADPRPEPRVAPRRGLRAALDTVSETGLARAVRRHFPADEDVVLSDSA